VLTVKQLGRILIVVVVVYAVFLSGMLLAMTRPPEQFGQVMRHVPIPLLRAVPFPPMWLWARRGTLAQGDVAPDFTLSTLDHKGSVTLSSHRGKRPVVLVFGSYT
jgi:hypothetical protein